MEYQLTALGLHRRRARRRASHRGIDISFIGSIGSPVNPGITTGRSVVFVASYVGTMAPAPTFRPYVGCMPASGGGGIPTALKIVARPADCSARPQGACPPGTTHRGERVPRRETLVDATHAVGFGTPRPPSASVTGTVTASRAVRGRRVLVSVRGDAELGRIRAIIQVHAVCSRVR